MRSQMLGATLAATVLLLAAPSAMAQDLPPKEEMRDFIGVDRFFAGSRMLGDVWLEVVTVALDTVKQLSTLPQPAVEIADRPLPKPVPWEVAFRVHLSARHDTSADYKLVIEPAPIAIEPCSTAVDAHGFAGIVPGAKMTLPWMSP